MDTKDEKYENNARRVRQVATRYLIRIQKSVFHGNLSEGKLREVEMLLRDIVKNTNDKIVFYIFDDNVNYKIVRINQEDEEEII